jgi:glycine/D-amino acid oxidase-like deaminating enzyme
MIDGASVAVLGAGIQGSCIALELARRGFDVALLEQDERALNRTSLRNEGKIHLGLVYANDTTLATARLQLEGALCFRALLAKWIGPAADQLRCSTPFNYLVAKDSFLGAKELTGHYAKVESICSELLTENHELDYLGSRPARLIWPLSPRQLEAHFSADRVAAGFGTAERSIDTDHLATLLRASISATPNLTFLPSRTVERVKRSNGILLVEGSCPEGSWRLTADQVVNATWESRLAIDRTMGLEHPMGWLYRLKYRVIARLPEKLRDAPSVTMVIGRYGDVVIRSDGTAYLSWYPAALRGWTHDIKPPAAWDAPCRGIVDDAQAGEIAKAVLEAIDAWFPGIGQAEPILVDAGAIVAHGHTDVDNPSSGLHGRAMVGVVSQDGYHSVDAGKLTTAPMFAMAAADAVTRWSD